MTVYLKSHTGVAVFALDGGRYHAHRRRVATDTTEEWVIFGGMFVVLAVLAVLQGAPPDLGALLSP